MQIDDGSISHKLLTPVLDGLVAAVFILDGDRRIIFANNAAVQQFDVRLIGVDFVQAIRDPACLKAIDKVLAGRKNSQVEITLQTPVRMTYHINISRLGAKNSIEMPHEARAIVSLENISHIFEAELMRSEFVANVSHELRSPLTALNGFIETLKGPARNDKKAQKRFLNIMQNEAKRMNRLIGDLLSLSKVEAKEHIRPEHKTDMIDLLNQAIESLTLLAKTENITIELKVADDIQTRLLADSDQILQVFLNLLENAIKYGGAGERVRVRVFNMARVEGVRGQAIGIAFKDEGAGIAPEHLPRLTERFYRVDTGRSREKGGTGLGLAIVKHIVARHRGRLQINSELGKGSSFTVFLPYHAP